jgi:hypothetical protein
MELEALKEASGMPLCYKPFSYAFSLEEKHALLVLNLREFDREKKVREFIRIIR